MDVQDDKKKAFSHFSFQRIHNFSRNHSSYRPNNFKGYSNKYMGTSKQFPCAFNRGYTNHCDYTYKGNREENIKINKSSDIQPWSEEAKEKERKQQVSDAANKLMNKLKMWNAKKNGEECKTDLTGPSVAKVYEEGINRSTDNSEKTHPKKHVGKLKRKSNFMQNKKSVESKNVTNKCHTIQYKQKKIQQNVISELLTMPKANLRQVLVDPKMHPKIEKGMAQIVKENRMILAQKFRALAESKMNNQGQFVCSNFVDDVGSFIDPDLAIDLCQLPPEVIKQMGEMFQLDFNPGNGNYNSSELDNNSGRDNHSEVEMDLSDTSLCNDSVSLLDVGNNDIMKIKTKPENKDNISSFHDVIEISEDEDFSEKYIKIEPKALGVPYCGYFEENSVVLSNDDSQGNSTSVVKDENICCSNISATKISSVSDSECNNSTALQQPLRIKKEFSSNCNNQTEIHKKNTLLPLTIKEEVFESIVPSNNEPNDVLQFSSTGVSKLCAESESLPETDMCLLTNETDIAFRTNSQCNAEVQTEIQLIDLDFNTEIVDVEENLIREVQMIDNLVHQLNKRKFSLFLKLTNLKSCTSNENSIKRSLLHTITNGDREIISWLENKSTGNKFSTKNKIKRPRQEQVTTSKQFLKKHLDNNT